MDIQILEFLKNFLTGNFAILGIGNTMKADDGFGSIVASELRKRLSVTPIEKRIFDGGIAPENFLGKILNMGIERLLIIDAVLYDGKASELSIFSAKELFGKFSLTHGPSNFAIFQNFLPKCEIAILAAMPRNLSFGKPLSAEMKAAIEHAIDLICESIGG